MAKVLSDETIRRRDIRVKLDWADIRVAAIRLAMEQAGIDSGAGPVADAQVDLKQEERGSPGYRIGEWTGVVRISIGMDETSSSAAHGG